METISKHPILVPPVVMLVSAITTPDKPIANIAFQSGASFPTLQHRYFGSEPREVTSILRAVEFGLVTIAPDIGPAAFVKMVECWHEIFWIIEDYAVLQFLNNVTSEPDASVALSALRDHIVIITDKAPAALLETPLGHFPNVIFQRDACMRINGVFHPIPAESLKGEIVPAVEVASVALTDPSFVVVCGNSSILDSEWADEYLEVDEGDDFLLRLLTTSNLIRESMIVSLQGAETTIEEIGDLCRRSLTNVPYTSRLPNLERFAQQSSVLDGQ
ncbi:hypothetical protein JVT61DRAFT_9922 [Boletus reticuloceps]|uniref:Uncharacterized protein n=1 Tax=Boletus reticuloceps TaxID=495285 RepID=A0A8I3A5D5_9AGAM|nr:hypothetical protein JVT61DRAFT_9922 [Boletus reticuloceps]